MTPRSEITRREFLKGALAAAAAPYVISSLASAAQGPPSSRIAVGVIGTGGQGMALMRALLGEGGVQVVAVCDVDRDRRSAAKHEVEKHYARQKRSGRFAGCAACNDFRTLLARRDIDAVAIATPDHWHALQVVAAARAGKDIYCEKPLSLTIAEGRAMADAVGRYHRVFQTGSQQRSDGRFRLACQLVRNGRIGRLHTITAGLPTGMSCDPQPVQPVPEGFDYDLWLGAAPWAPYTAKRCHYQFRWILDYSGGRVTDWGAHHNDIAQWGGGTERSGPVAVEGAGEFPTRGLYNAAVNFRFACTYRDGVRLICTNRAPNGVRFEGTDGWVFVSRRRIDAHPKRLLRERFTPEDVHLYRSPGHVRNFLACVRSRAETVAPVEVAHRSATICHLGNIAMLLGRSLRWDPRRERFVGDDEANRMVARAMREPWRL
jgi:predicted dehydrogenase